MTPTGKTLATGLGAATVIGMYFVLRSPSPQPEQTPLSATVVAEMNTQSKAAALNAPPGWNFCTMPSYYIRACEAGPYSLRWGNSPGCSSIAICGNHAAQCGGDDGFTYPIIGQFVNGVGDRYPEPPDTAGTVAVNSWIDCYINHNTAGPGNRGGCATAQPHSGRLIYSPITWAQLPEGGQKRSWGAKYGCLLTPSPSISASPSPVTTRGCVMVTVTPASVCVTPTP